MGRNHVHAAWEVENRGDFLSLPPLIVLLFLLQAQFPQEAGGQEAMQSQSWGSGWGEVAEPQARGPPLWCLLPTLKFHFPRLSVRQAHGTRLDGVGGGGKKCPIALAHPKVGLGFSQEQIRHSPMSPLSWAGFGRKGRRKLHQQPHSRTRGKGVRGVLIQNTPEGKDREREVGRREKKQRGDEMH